VEGIFMYELRIKEFRNLSRLTQRELASRAGISQNFLSEIESGMYDIKVSLLYKIAKALNVCPHELINQCNNCLICDRNKFFYP
jgi:transcriptional regulator with XRE-family HTH domain